MKLSVQVNGKLVRQGLETLDGEVPKIGRRRIRTTMNRVYRIVSPYPPPPNALASKRRTGNLFAHWRIEQLPEAGGYSISNTATRKGQAYGQYVNGDAYGGRQRWFHKAHGWENTRDVVETEVEKLPDEIEKEIILVARKAKL